MRARLCGIALLLGLASCGANVTAECWRTCESTCAQNGGTKRITVIGADISCVCGNGLHVAGCGGATPQ